MATRRYATVVDEKSTVPTSGAVLEILNEVIELLAVHNRFFANFDSRLDAVDSGG